MKKTAKAAALIAAMVLAAGLTACQKKESAGGSGAIKVSAKDAEKAAGYLIMDGTTVMGYKEGLPAKLVIPAGVTEIGKEAFSGCDNLKKVKYAGTKAQWEEIETTDSSGKYTKNKAWIGDSFAVNCTDGAVRI